MQIIIGFIILSLAAGLLVFLFYLFYTIPVKDYVDREQREEKLRVKDPVFPDEHLTESEWLKHIEREVKQLYNN